MSQFISQPAPDVVDNLTTNDSTKALSAAQGYALNSKITSKATWLYAKAKTINVHLENSSELFVMALSHNFASVFHASGNGTISGQVDLTQGYSITVTKTTNTITFTSSSDIALNAIAEDGKAWIV